MDDILKTLWVLIAGTGFNNSKGISLINSEITGHQ